MDPPKNIDPKFVILKNRLWTVNNDLPVRSSLIIKDRILTAKIILYGDQLNCLI